MLVFVLNTFNIVLLTIGVFFIVIDWKTQFDKSFRYFGLSTIFVTSFIIADSMWISHAYETKNKVSLLYAALISHELLIFCYFPVVFYSMKVLINKPVRFTWVWIIASWLLSISLLWTDIYFEVRVPEFKVHNTKWYKIIVTPFLFSCMAYSVWLSYNAYKNVPLHKKRLYLYNFIGTSCLIFTAVIDLIYFLSPSLSSEISFISMSHIVYASLITYGFLEHFLEIIREKENLSINLSQAYREVTEGKSLQQIGESTAKINHELKNYLAIIQNNLPTLQLADGILPQSNQGKIRSIVHASERMNTLCDNILGLARQQPVTGEPVINLNDSLQQCVKKNFSQNSHFFHVIAPEEVFEIQIKPEKWEQVLLNLFNNAIEAEASHITLESHKFQNLIILSIRDNGRGSSPQNLSKLFQAFFTTKEHSGGTGLGLSISKTIIENVGGWISVYNRKPRGIEFNIQFPIPKKSSSNLYEASPKLPSIVLWAQSERILKEVQKKCELLQIPLSTHPLSEWNPSLPQDTTQTLALHLVESSSLESIFPLEKREHPSNLYFIYDDDGIYIDGDPFSEIFLATYWEQL